MFLFSRVVALLAIMGSVAAQIQPRDPPSRFPITNYTLPETNGTSHRLASGFGLRQNEEFFTFDYFTTTPNAGNWIGVYPSNGGPVDQVKVEPSLVWEYARGASGTITIPAGDLRAGTYRAFFLAREGYTWLSSPQSVTIPTFRSSFREITGWPRFTFQYDTTDVQSTNWVGIYPRDGGPVNQLKGAQSLAWSYARGGSGQVTVPADDLEWGNYRAYYLQRNGYRWLANPIAVTIPRASGTLTWFQNGEIFTFDYVTNDPSTLNWIGIYPADGGPVDEVKGPQSLAWVYAPGASGRVTVRAGSLAGGTYRAFYLSRDGYKSITRYITVRAPDIRFAVSEITTRNARVGTAFQVRVGGLTLGRGGSATFSKVSGPGWVSVSGDGRLTGTPTSPGETHVRVRASTSTGASSELAVRIPVRPSGSCMVQDVRVMTYNMWYGGTQMNNYNESQIQALVASNADVVGLQEADPHRARELSAALGWFYIASADPGNVALMSRYPITSSTNNLGYAVAARIELDGSGQEIVVWNAHLNAHDYGPYLACDDRRPVSAILEAERRYRGNALQTVVDGMRGHLGSSSNVPVFLTGDFNAPSHLDWTPALRNKNCGYADIDWPTSRIPLNAGLIDSYRVANPDPAAQQGNTWSPINPFRNGNSGPVEPQDRIDYTLHAGSSVRVLESRTFHLGNPSARPNHRNNVWTSDHLAVLTNYRINQGTC